MNILITGGSGLIGSYLTDKLTEEGHKVTVLDIVEPEADVEFIKSNLLENKPPLKVFKNKDAIIHLAGISIFKRWTSKVKQLIKDSRVVGTRNLVRALRELDEKPEVLVSASAVGYYGDGKDKTITESSTVGNGFLASVCEQWEKEARKVKEFGMRAVQIRTAPILARNGGVLSQMLLPYKLGLGGPLGSGEQWFPWIHIDDIAGMYKFVIKNKEITGPYNAVAPNKVKQKTFSSILAEVLNRPHFIKVPKFLLRIILGEMASVVLTSQKVSSKKIREEGYNFKYPKLKSALENILV